MSGAGCRVGADVVNAVECVGFRDLGFWVWGLGCGVCRVRDESVFSARCLNYGFRRPGLVFRMGVRARWVGSLLHSRFAYLQTSRYLGLGPVSFFEFRFIVSVCPFIYRGQFMKVDWVLLHVCSFSAWGFHVKIEA